MMTRSCVCYVTTWWHVEVPVLRLVWLQASRGTVGTEQLGQVGAKLSRTVANPDIKKVWGRAVQTPFDHPTSSSAGAQWSLFKSHDRSTSPALNFIVLLFICFSRAPWILWKWCPFCFVKLKKKDETRNQSNHKLTYRDNIRLGLSILHVYRLHCKDICICETHDLISKGLCVAPMTCPLFLRRQVCVISGPYRCLNALHHGDILYCCSVRHAALIFLTTHQVFPLKSVPHCRIDVPDY